MPARQRPTFFIATNAPACASAKPALMLTMRDLTFKAASESDLKRENANIDGDTAMGTMLKYGSEASKQFYEMYMLKRNTVRLTRMGIFTSTILISLP